MDQTSVYELITETKNIRTATERLHGDLVKLIEKLSEEIRANNKELRLVNGAYRQFRVISEVFIFFVFIFILWRVW